MNLIDDLVVANRILYDHSVVDGFGHISVRHPKQDRFLLSRNMAPGLVTHADIMEFDLDGAPCNSGPAVYLERFIHAAIYRVRPDVNAVVHSHSASVIPFGVTNTSLRPVYHMSAFLSGSTPVFDIRDAAGMTDMLISNNSLADALAASLGNHSVVLMRGHGSVTVGSSIPIAVYRAIYTEINAQLQLKSNRLGPIKFLAEEEAAKAEATIMTQVNRTWDLWKNKIAP